MTPALEARAVLRLIDRERILTARLSAVRSDLRPIAQRLCDAHGYRTLLTGPALERLAIQTVGKPA